MKIKINNIKKIEQEREIGDFIVIKANTKQVEFMSKIINSLEKLINKGE